MLVILLCLTLNLQLQFCTKCRSLLLFLLALKQRISSSDSAILMWPGALYLTRVSSSSPAAVRMCPGVRIFRSGHFISDVLIMILLTSSRWCVWSSAGWAPWGWAASSSTTQGWVTWIMSRVRGRWPTFRHSVICLHRMQRELDSYFNMYHLINETTTLLISIKTKNKKDFIFSFCILISICVFAFDCWEGNVVGENWFNAYT